MKRIYNIQPRGLSGRALMLFGAILVSLSAWQGFAALGKSPRSTSTLETVSYRSPAYEMRAIESLRPGDKVLAFDPETGNADWKTVRHALRKVTNHLRILEIQDCTTADPQTIRTTDEHPFWVIGLGWTPAGELKVGTDLQLADGRSARVRSSQREEHPERIRVFNLTVDDYHTYFVAQNSTHLPVLVHNANNADECIKAAKAASEALQAASKNGDEAVDAAQRAARRNTAPSPALDEVYAPDGTLVPNPYSPREVSKRQSDTRRQLGLEPDPEVPIPDQKPGHNLKSKHEAKSGTPHDTQERNVNRNEEHSRRPKGGPKTH